MNTSTTRAWVGLAVLVVVLGLLLFVPAGSLHYWQEWVYLTLFALSAGAITYYLMKRDPALLARRMHGGPLAEKEQSQRLIMYDRSGAGVVRSYSAKNSICAACWSNSRRRSAPGATWARTGTVSAPTSIVASGCASRL
jgi:hypothetical protein